MSQQDSAFPAAGLGPIIDTGTSKHAADRNVPTFTIIAPPHKARVFRHRSPDLAPDHRGTEFYIYLLSDPISGTVRYVGCTTWPGGRRSQHMRGHGITKPWVLGLRSTGLAPTWDVVEIVFDVANGPYAHKRERRLVERFASPQLLNRVWNPFSKGGTP